jgi:hypothetical protein
MRGQGQSLDRNTAAHLPAQRLAAEIFGAPVGAAVMDIAPNGSGLIVAHVEAVHRQDPSAPQARTFIEQQRQQVQQALSRSMLDVITAEAVRQGHARRNNALIHQMFNARAGGEDSDSQ